MLFVQLFKGKGSTVHQYSASIIVNILTLAHGCALGWTSPSLPYLKSEDTHLKEGPADANAISWIGSSISFGALIGALVCGKLAVMIGKKKLLLFLTLPNVTFWCMVFLSKNLYHLYIARGIAGLTGGGLFRVMAIFIGEISENHVRGALGAIFALAMYGGMLMIFLLGAYLDFFTVPLVVLPLPIISLILMLFLPETPQFLIQKGKNTEAIEALKFYRNCSNEDKVKLAKIDEEFESLKNAVNNVQDNTVKLKDFVAKNARLGMLMGFFLVFVVAFSGNFIIMTYTAFIFSLSGSALSPNNSSVIIATTQLIGIVVAGACADRFGRKILMTISCAGSTITLACMGTYVYLNEIGTNLNGLSWIPLVTLSLVIFLNSVGISSLPFMMITELVPFKIREHAVMIFMVIVTIFMFISLKIFPIVVEMINLSGCLWFFLSICFLGTFISIFVMPETKGKNLFDAEN
ncbi:hypothetical protein PVAND_013510 [Polypedilum vanderplanki]|uniref:Major facilitator superfamily (MFS) profile domain-containing protein n=1 Tax=Polypedilum vanderplanki TaxID=319348 RepID=A0A9J6CPN6_POLVA|nr:hypothetical protein PVAND_013510 [Polypedilum vanderplanki]